MFPFFQSIGIVLVYKLQMGINLAKWFPQNFKLGTDLAND